MKTDRIDFYANQLRGIPIADLGRKVREILRDATAEAELEVDPDALHIAYLMGDANGRDKTRSGARHGIYFASKVIHSDKWRRLRNAGVPTASTWIDEAGEGQTADYAELSERCLREIAGAEFLLLYCEPGELLKGALLEAGAALAVGTPVRLVGDCPSLSRVFRKHPLWREFSSVDDAIALRAAA